MDSEIALAHLLFRSNWTQEELAREEGKSEAWITYRLRFGKFLKEFTMVNFPKTLTERRFRSYWDGF